MQRFDRGTEAPPSVLGSLLAQRGRLDLREYLYLQSREKRSQTPTPRVELDIDDDSVTTALSRLFHGRCAFCESEIRTAAYHFRPTAEAQPGYDSIDSHLSYIWLAQAWNNLYSICAECRPENPQYFPVTKGQRAPIPTEDQLDSYVRENNGLWRWPIQEKPLLLDPCGSKEFHDHLMPTLDGRLIGISPSGRATIRHFWLDRESLEQDRAHRIDRLFDELLREVSKPPNLAVNQHERTRFMRLFDFAELEFGGIWYLLLRRLARAAIKLRDRQSPHLAPDTIHDFYMDMRVRGEGRNQLLLEAANRLEDLVPHRSPPPALIAHRSSSHRIARVELRNFKSIQSLDLDMPSPRPGSDDSGSVPALLILGENSTGKSSVLEAVALALSNKAAHEKLRKPAASFLFDPGQMGGDRAAAASIARVRILLSDGNMRELTFSREGMLQRMPDPEETISVFAYGAFRRYAQKIPPYRPDRHIRNLFHDDALGNPDPWLLSLTPARFAMAIRALRGILSIEGEFEVIERREKRCEMASGGRDMPITYTPLEAVSSGYRSVLAMVCDIIKGLMDKRICPDFESLTAARGVVLIDEIEAHLHPRWKMQIMRNLREALPRMTFIATTHDPLCLRGMQDDEVVVMQRIRCTAADPSGPQVKVEVMTELPNISELRVEQLLTSDLFQLNSSDSREIELKMAKVGDLLARQHGGEYLDIDEMNTIDEFQRDIAAALPIGTSEGHRLVQEAVAEYLRQRRAASNEQLRHLRADTRQKIVRILESH